ncbi:MAG: tyrosine-type recombinase/integrase [Bdellovibrionia bacterium]
MKIQQYRHPDTGKKSWMVLGDNFLPFQPVCEFLEFQENVGRSPNTIRAHALRLKTLLEFLKERRKSWQDLDLQLASEFVSWLRLPNPSVVPMFEFTAKRLDSTINAYVGSLSVFAEYCVQRGLGCEKLSHFVLRINPSKRYKPLLHHITKGKAVRTSLLKKRVLKRIPRTLNRPVVLDLIRSCRTWRDRLLLGLLYQGGLRIGQVLGLRHSDIHSWENAVFVEPRDDNSNGARAKTKESYKVEVPQELMSVYTRYVLDEFGDIQSDYVFVNLWGGDVGRPLTYSSVVKVFRRLSNKVGTKVTPHMFRHTHATELLKAGMRAEVARKRLGHKDVQTTLNTYEHLSFDDTQAEYHQFQKSLSTQIEAILSEELSK